MRPVFLALVLSAILAAAVPEEVQKLAIGQKMIVILPDGREHFGRLSRIGGADFDLRDGESGQLKTFRYDDVKKVLKGYGGRTINSGRAHAGRQRVITLVGRRLAGCLGVRRRAQPEIGKPFRVAPSTGGLAPP